MIARRDVAKLGVLAALAFGLAFLPARNGGSNDAPRIADQPEKQGQRETTRIGLVFDIGGRGDKSFNDGAYVGLTRAARELGVEVEYIEPSGAEDREAALRLFATRGFDLVAGVGFLFSSDVDTVAHAYPNVHFACIDYAPRGDTNIPDNVAGLAFREEEGSFLVGAVAGLMTKTKHVGFVGGMTGPLIRKFEAGYEAGLKQTCAECRLHSAYAGVTPDAYRDPEKGKALGIAEATAGADIIYQAAGSTGHGVFEAVREARILGIGVDADQYDEAPGFVLTSMVKRVDVALYETIRATKDRKFSGGMQVFGLKEGGVDYVHEGAHGKMIPSDVKAKIEELRRRIVAREIAVPDK